MPSNTKGGTGTKRNTKAPKSPKNSAKGNPQQGTAVPAWIDKPAMVGVDFAAGLVILLATMVEGVRGSNMRLDADA